MTSAEPRSGVFGSAPVGAWSASPQKLPRFPVRVALPNVRRWLPGNAGIPGVWRFAAASPGPHVVITSLIHGNEIAGALALDILLRDGPNPARGTLTLVFANLEAAARFDASNPTASRFVDEDMNRLWDASALAGSRTSHELARARALQPVIDAADVLLDLHSMLWPSDPLILCGPSEKGRALARAVGVPPLVVADHGHLGGKRLIDYAPFVDPADPRTAILVEAGPHWEPETVRSTLATVAGVLGATGLGPLSASVAPGRVAEVTLAITANSGAFAFAASYRGGDVIKHRNTLIATDGGVEIRTPYDDCVLIMPSLRPSCGHTAVRLAKYVENCIEPAGG
jgi:predicted deacylase